MSHYGMGEHNGTVSPREGSSSGGGGGKNDKNKGGAKAPLARGSACTVCRKRKLRCDGLRPACTTCSRLSHACSYADPIHEKLNDKNRELQAKIELLEAELDTLKNGSRASELPPLSPTVFPAPFPKLEQDIDSYNPLGQQAVHLPILSHSPTSSNSATPPFHDDSLPNTLQDPNAFGDPTMDLFTAQNLQSFPFAVTGNPPSISDLMNPAYEERRNSQSSQYPIPNLQQPQTSPTSQSSVPLPAQDWRWQQAPAQPSMEVIHLWGGDLPHLDLIIQLANLYFSTIHVHLPFIHRPRFLYSLHHPTSLASPPSLCLVFAILAIAAPYHNDPNVRERAKWWYQSAKSKIEAVINTGINDNGGPKTNLSLEIVQALIMMELIEMGQSEHQRAFMTMGTTVRVAQMLGLHRMDEDRIAERLGQISDRRLRPPAIHPLPTDSLLLEECRRTMCAVFVVDRLESGATGWPFGIDETAVRLLLPCDEKIYEAGNCTTRDNPLWWPVLPTTIENEDQAVPRGPKIGTFAWLIRTTLIGGRVQAETYRASGVLADGPFRIHELAPPIEDLGKIMEMDQMLHILRTKLNVMATVGPGDKALNAPIIMCLITVNCLFVCLHHLRVALMRSLPYNPSGRIIRGSPEFSMQRCLEGIHSLHTIFTQLAVYENGRTSPYQSRVTIFTTFVPYVLYCIAFPAKFTIGDWSVIGDDRSRTEKVHGRIVVGPAGPQMPSGDDVFGPSADDSRLDLIDTLCDAMNRVGEVWSVGKRFEQAVRADRNRLAARVVARYPPTSQASNNIPRF